MVKMQASSDTIWETGPDKISLGINPSFVNPSLRRMTIFWSAVEERRD
jgi:hypothetical protein